MKDKSIDVEENELYASALIVFNPLPPTEMPCPFVYHSFTHSSRPTSAPNFPKAF